MGKWIVLLFGFWGLYEMITRIARNMGDAYYQAAINEQFGCEIIKQPRIYMLSGTYYGCCDGIIDTLKCMGCKTTGQV